MAKAIMVPNVPFAFDPASQEGIIFNSFAEHLDSADNEPPYYVFHSYKMRKDVRPIGEIDFLIYHRQKGILCIEAKAGQVKFEDRTWKYADGTPIHNGEGPYRQVESAMWELKRLIDDKYEGLLY